MTRTIISSTMAMATVIGLVAISTHAFCGAQLSRRTAIQITSPYNDFSLVSLAAKRIPRATASSSSNGSGPKSASPRRRPTRDRATTIRPRRAPHQFDHTTEQARPFVDAATELKGQSPNKDAPVFDMATVVGATNNNLVPIIHPHIQSVSLDEIVPGLSSLFATSRAFRTELRQAMREDMFDTSPAYQSLPAKARSVLLLPDSSLQGSWKCTAATDNDDDDNNNNDEMTQSIRMQRLTDVLQQYLASSAAEDCITGDQLMERVGALCRGGTGTAAAASSPSTHWIDIVGVQNRRIPHSWHQDTGRSDANTARTVLWGFPPDDDDDDNGYRNVGVFSHFVKLRHEQWASQDHPANQPVLYKDLVVGDEYIVRPLYEPGRELLVYRDVDVLHSSPDVACRASVMRFM